jgi:hypothetical protein
VLDADWFADDIVDRFRKFLRVTFGEAQFPENLAFIEAQLGKDIRRGSPSDFYDDHVRATRSARSTGCSPAPRAASMR